MHFNLIHVGLLSINILIMLWDHPCAFGPDLTRIIIMFFHFIKETRGPKGLWVLT